MTGGELRTTSVSLTIAQILVKCRVMVSLSIATYRCLPKLLYFQYFSREYFYNLQFDMKEIAFERIDTIVAISVDGGCMHV